MREFQLKKKVLVVLSEWGFWGEELIGPHEVLSGAGYAIEFATTKRPIAPLPSMDPFFENPPLGESITAEMAEKAINDPRTPISSTQRHLAAWFPELPYWSEKEILTYDL
jgi:hypothetical protein